jgi:hypothetical protein
VGVVYVTRMRGGWSCVANVEIKDAPTLQIINLIVQIQMHQGRKAALTNDK